MTLWPPLRQEIKFRAYEYFVGLTRNPEWFWMRRTGRSQIFRRVSHSLRQRQYRMQPPMSAPVTGDRAALSHFPDLDIPPIVKSLEQTGLYQKLQLPEAVVQSVVAFAQTTPCYGNGRPSLGFFYRHQAAARQECPQPLVTATYLNADRDCDAIQTLVQDAGLRAIAAAYLQAPPVYLGSRLWWSFPSSSLSQSTCPVTQAFHYDLDGYRFLKFFFYLTEVDENSGPHIYMQGTHRCMKWRHRLLRKRYRDRAILDAYGCTPWTVLCGPAGYGFVEDTFGFHKGAVPVTRDRLILQIEYGVKDYGMEHQTVAQHHLRLLPGQEALTNG
ncbi:MAG: hypothetical protein HC838_07365 [Spirulinaceae cyanobacterium RM2_2_10]|nr:hypothetical protein [Spirulinaceae cyanobacterium SM2_1_0]NJO19911.1 hypothetical protein [Spirulinaceae cyanobacterium RM2_2_10]